MLLWGNPCSILSPQGLRWSFPKCLLGWHMIMSFWSVHHIPLNVTGSGKITDQGRFIPCHKHLFCSCEKLEKRQSMVLPVAILSTGEESPSENGAKVEEDTSERGSQPPSPTITVWAPEPRHISSPSLALVFSNVEPVNSFCSWSQFWVRFLSLATRRVHVSWFHVSLWF